MLISYVNQKKIYLRDSKVTKSQHRVSSCISIVQMFSNKVIRVFRPLAIPVEFTYVNQ
jgi:hypothetical protein